VVYGSSGGSAQTKVLQTKQTNVDGVLNLLR
jgi:hypothetical protein